MQVRSSHLHLSLSGSESLSNPMTLSLSGSLLWDLQFPLSRC